MPLVLEGKAIVRRPTLTVAQTERAIRLARRLHHEFHCLRREDGSANGSAFGIPARPMTEDSWMTFCSVIVELLDEQQHPADDDEMCEYCKENVAEPRRPHCSTSACTAAFLKDVAESRF